MAPHMRNTNAAVLFQVGKPLRHTPLMIPDLKSGQLLVDISYSGICHTNLLEARGKRGPDPFLPHTLGHEGSGIVVEIGDNVEKVQPGDHVVLSWIKGAGIEVPSTSYMSPDGPINSGAISTFMQRTVTCENRITKIPKSMPLKEAALLGCAIPTGAGMVLNTANVRPGSTVAVFGVGGIGLSAVLAASLANATTIIAVDLLDSKLNLAEQNGATHVVNGKDEDPLQFIKDVTEGLGVDFAIEAAGSSTSMEQAFQSVRENGGLCVVAGNLPHGERISIDPFEFIKGKRIIGTWGGGTRPDEDILTYIKLYQSCKLKLDELITHTYRLEDINSGMSHLEEGRVGRAIIDMNL